MAYKNKTSFTIAFDSSSPHTAMDALIDFITNRFIADVPEISVQHEIAYDADAYKNFPVFSGVNVGSGVVPASKIVFLGKNSNSIGLMLMCYLNGSKYYLSMRVMPSFDMMCVTPATYGDNYKSVADACKYIYYHMRGYTFNAEIDQKFDITPGTDNNMYISIISAVGKHACAYCINSGRTSFENYRLAFIRDKDGNLKSLWWENYGYSVFDIDYKFPLKAGYFSPSKYNQTSYGNDIFVNFSTLDNNDTVFTRVILLGWHPSLDSSACGLKIFILGVASQTSFYLKDLSSKTPFTENLSDKKKSYTLWTNEFFPSKIAENQIFLRQMTQPITSETFIHLYRMAINSQTTPKAGNVYKTSQGVFMSLTPYVVGYAVKLGD